MPTSILLPDQPASSAASRYRNCCSTCPPMRGCWRWGGVHLVGQTGQMLDRIVAKVDEVRGLITEISASTEAQASNLQQVNGTTGHMDSRTQHNPPLVKQR